MADEQRADISMHHISVRGGLGAGVLIVILVAVMLADLPALRWPVLGSAALGVLFAVGLILWRRRSMGDNRLPPGAHTMLVESFGERPAASGEADRDRAVTPPGAHPRVAPAS